jgi:hypothetical protein
MHRRRPRARSLKQQCGTRAGVGSRTRDREENLGGKVGADALGVAQPTYLMANLATAATAFVREWATAPVSSPACKTWRTGFVERSLDGDPLSLVGNALGEWVRDGAASLLKATMGDALSGSHMCGVVM